MKRLLIICLSAALVSLAGCSDDEDIQPAQKEKIVSFLTGTHAPRLVAEENLEEGSNQPYYTVSGDAVYRYITDIYNPDGPSLKDAIIIFGPGCTGEIVSPDGLIFTNHHCGYSSIQQLSTTENDYLANGFWAMDRSEEIPVPGLSVHFIRKIEEVTDRMTEGLEGLPFEEYTAKVNERRGELTEAYRAEYPGKKAFFNLNK